MWWKAGTDNKTIVKFSFVLIHQRPTGVGGGLGLVPGNSFLSGPTEEKHLKLRNRDYVKFENSLLENLKN